MKKNKITYESIGTIHTPFKSIAGMPIQSVGAKGVTGEIRLNKKFVRGLKDLDGFSHIILIYHFHRVKEYRLLLVPFLDKTRRGLFATRAPKRPNPIGFSVVKLNKIQGHILYVENIDVLDGTPLLDIKPYVKYFDAVKYSSSGWLEKVSRHVINKKSDERFK